MASKFENCAAYSNGIGVGDEVSYTTTHYRRWWQFWKPKSWKETNRYRVVRGMEVRSPVTLTDGYWKSWPSRDSDTRPQAGDAKQGSTRE